MIGDPFAYLAGWVTGGVESLGDMGVAVLIALENFFPPIPSPGAAVVWFVWRRCWQEGALWG